jgi:hypothetical protein
MLQAAAAAADVLRMLGLAAPLLQARSICGVLRIAP